MTHEDLPEEDPLSVVRSVVSSNMGADRTDAYKRDGILAGGEYGHYEVARICDAPRIFKSEDQWKVRYDDRQISSMEALLFERYRTYVWIHFHHATVTFKALMSRLIADAFSQGIVGPSDFSPANPKALVYRDDAWLVNILRNLEDGADPHRGMIQRALFLREKENVSTLWKRRTDYMERLDAVRERVGREVDKIHNAERVCRVMLESHGIAALHLEAYEGWKEEKYIYLCRDNKPIKPTLQAVSFLLRELNELWEQEPKEHFVFVGSNAHVRHGELAKVWQEAVVTLLRSE